MAWRTLLFFIICWFSSMALGQVQSGNTPVQSDSAAVQLVTSMIASCGWNLPAPTTIVANGTVTVNGTPEPIVVEAMPGWLRIGRPQSNVVVLVHGTQGELITNGVGRYLNGGESASIQAFIFPFYTQMTSVADPSLALTLGAQRTIQGASAQVINFASNPPVQANASSTQPGLTIGVSISLSSFQPVAVHLTRMSQADGTKGTGVDVSLSDFRPVGGMLVPFQYAEGTQSESFFNVQFDTVTFNVPIAASDFAFVASN
jgi:hypothetical protein